MRIFIYEYTCARESAGSSLAIEGEAMLAAVLHDFAAVPGVKVVTLLPPGRTVGPQGVACRRILPEQEESAFRAEAKAATWTLVIAPEFDHILETRCVWVEEAGGQLLGPRPEAVRLTADKAALGAHLRRAGVSVPAESATFPAVCKPRFGAGSQATFLVRNSEEWQAALDQATAEGWAGELIRQPFIPGQPASVAFLVGPAAALPLLPAEQWLSDDGRFHYRGGRIPLPPDLAARAQQLAARAVAAVPGLRGYVGVDVVLGPDPEGSGDVVIEINPRLTTSYVGLRALARCNLAAAMLAVQEGPTDLPWRSGTVTFTPEGTVTEHPESDPAPRLG